MVEKEFAVFGLGKFGSSIALTLAEAGQEVVAIDQNEERVQAVADAVTYAATADVTDADVIENLGLRNLDCAIIAISSDMESSIMATILAKEHGVPYVVAKAENDMHKKILEKVGADKVVFPEREMGNRLARNLVGGNFIDMVELSTTFSLVEIKPLKEWIGKSIRSLDIRSKYHMNIVGIRTSDGKNGDLDAMPNPDMVLTQEMTMFIAGKNDDLRKISINV